MTTATTPTYCERHDRLHGGQCPACRDNAMRRHLKGLPPEGGQS